jgi:hypothetical protein
VNITCSYLSATRRPLYYSVSMWSFLFTKTTLSRTSKLVSGQPPLPGPELALRCRRLLQSILLVVLTIESAASGVRAQTTGFLGYGSPSTVPYGSAEPVYIKVVVFYKDAKPGYVLIAGLFDDEKGGELKGTATGSPDPCTLAAEQTINTTCAVLLRGPTGQNNVTFGFTPIANLHALGVWHLRVASGLDSQGKVVQGSLFSYGISVQVVNAVTARTGTTSTISSTSSPSDGSNNGLVAVISVGLIIFILFVLKRGRKPKSLPKRDEVKVRSQRS